MSRKGTSTSDKEYGTKKTDTIIHSFIHSFIHMDASPSTGGHPYIHIYVIGAKRKFCSDHIKLLIISSMYI